MVTLEDIRQDALNTLKNINDGQELSDQTKVLIKLGISASVTALNTDAIYRYTEAALKLNITAEQIHETLELVSGLGVHTFMEGSTIVANVLQKHGHNIATEPLDTHQKNLWEKHIGDDRYWDEMEKEIPGFLNALLRISPAAFEGFFNYCAIPWKSGKVDALSKELISMACDATPTHRYLPGVRLHLKNALNLGAGRNKIIETLEIAASAPPHIGIRH